ncbi:MAG: transcription elongation factor GreA [Gemmatimonadetes bacterium]|nr:transcription elongation factor GreA [Gemmatimonadota bacterium]
MLEEIKQKIEEELQRLHHELTVTLPIAIRKAVELGDLRENADYKSALERQQFVQARIGHLTQRLSELSKIDLAAIPEDRVGFGSKVRLRDVATGHEVEHTIVAGDYIDIDAGHISMASPIGRALLGKRVGEEVQVNLPAGVRTYLVLELVTLPQMVNE